MTQQNNNPTEQSVHLAQRTRRLAAKPGFDDLKALDLLNQQ